MTVKQATSQSTIHLPANRAPTNSTPTGEIRHLLSPERHVDILDVEELQISKRRKESLFVLSTGERIVVTERRNCPMQWPLRRPRYGENPCDSGPRSLIVALYAALRGGYRLRTLTHQTNLAVSKRHVQRLIELLCLTGSCLEYDLLFNIRLFAKWRSCFFYLRDRRRFQL